MSATDELRRLLDERGVEHTDAVSFTAWNANGVGYMAESNPHRDNYLILRRNATPEQAIAATLGGGRLTAEQVRVAIFNGSGYASFDGAKYYADGIGMQAIADEINAMLGNDGVERTKNGVAERGTCHMERADWDDGTCTWGCVCSACGEKFEHETGRGWHYCPNCGAEVAE